MVIEVSYKSAKDAKIRIHSSHPRNISESDQIPGHNTVLRKLKSMGVDFDENTISINPRPDGDADGVRQGRNSRLRILTEQRSASAS
jgi:hypothetical protein